MFKIVLPFYIFGIALTILLYLIGGQMSSLIMLIIGPGLHIMLPILDRPFKRKLDILTSNLRQAELESDPVKRLLGLSMASMRNCNICAMLSNTKNDEQQHWHIMAVHYDNLRKHFREEAMKLSSR